MSVTDMIYREGKLFISLLERNTFKMSSVLSRRGTTTAPVRIRTVQTQVSALEKAREGSKTEFTRIMTTGNLEQHGMSVRLTPQDINAFSADQLYEIAYGGTSDYWRSPVFTSLRRKESEFVADLIREINVVESIYNCPACNYDRVLVRQEQKGGGDESMTTMFRCTKCGHNWSNSGRG